MGNIQELKGKRKILEMFPATFDPLSSFNDYSESEYLETLGMVERNIPFKKENANLSLCLFLYSGCLKFDRFTVPTPYVFNPENNKIFYRFLNALIKAEKGLSHNTLSFSLKKIRGQVYEKFEQVDLNAIDKKHIDSFRTKVSCFTPPTTDEKLREFSEQKSKIIAILDGLENKTLLTKIETKIPYIIYTAPLSIKAKWDGIPFVITINPTYKQHEEKFFKVDGIAQSSAPSRWQSGHSQIVISLASLIDCDLHSEPLQMLHQENTPTSGWPKCFVLAFKIIQDIAWKIRIEHSSENQWVPTPRDIDEITWSLSAESLENIEWKRMGAPSELIKVSQPTDQVTHFDFGEVEDVAWSEKCKSLAVMYSGMGQHEEALFWLNAGIEAFFDEGFKKISEELGRPDLLDELGSPKAFWQPADEVVTTQFPEMAGKINWPNDQIHVSMYAKLKFLYKNYNMKTSVKKLKNEYRVINKYRNNLFHGKDKVNITPEAIQKALESFAWIKENFKLATE